MLRAFSYGGGTQSTAALVLAAQGRIDYPLFLFSNVGDDSEWPETLTYVRDVAMPFAAAAGVELLELSKDETLLEHLGRVKRSIPIPMRMPDTGMPGNRSCTPTFKIRVVAAELRRRGATAKTPATIGLGISLDEYQRARTPTDPRQPLLVREYPLLDLRIDRADCQAIIKGAGLPVPPKSACWFCPFNDPARWKQIRRDRRDLFDRAVELERNLQARRAELGKVPVYLTRRGGVDGINLDELFTHDQLTLDGVEDDSCESGFCMT